MPKLNHRLPSYRKHTPSGQAVVTLEGHDYYLGPHGTMASKREYDRLLGEWQANGRRIHEHDPITVTELAAAYWKFAKGYYKNEGRNTQDCHIKATLRYLTRLYGHTPAKNFGPLAFKAVRHAMISDGRFCRNYINALGGWIKRIFRWGTQNELVPTSVYHGLQAVSGLRKGRCEARESEPVKPVPTAFVEAALRHVSPQVAAMIRLQELTGMRPGEVLIMRSCDLDTSGKIWTYTPERHKTEYHGHERVIYLGPQAQAVLRSWLRTELDAYLFSPAEAEAVRNAERRQNRKTAMTPSQAKRHPKRNPKRPKRHRYTVDTYRRAIARACELACPLPAHLGCRRLPDDKTESQAAWWARLTATEKTEVRAWRRLHSWHPHQLRDNAATRLRKEYGIEAARVVLGHRSAVVTEVYAEIDRMKAAEIMLRVG